MCYYFAKWWLSPDLKNSSMLGAICPKTVNHKVLFIYLLTYLQVWKKCAQHDTIQPYESIFWTNWNKSTYQETIMVAYPHEHSLQFTDWSKNNYCKAQPSHMQQHQNISLNKTHTHTHTQPFYWHLSGTTRVSRYQKGITRKVKASLDLLEQEIVSGSGICWAICKSAPHPREPRQHPTTQFFTGQMPFLTPNQQRQSTEGNCLNRNDAYKATTDRAWNALTDSWHPVLQQKRREDHRFPALCRLA